MFKQISLTENFEKEKIFDLINDKGLRDSESKHVKSKLQFTF